MIGIAAGSMVSTRDLKEGQVVSIDHEAYEVTEVKSGVLGWVVTLSPNFGSPWDLEVAHEDYLEAIWERV